MRVSHLWRHPIKGHGVEAVAGTVLTPGETMPWDRVWAIAQDRAKLGDGASWVPCVNFGRGAKSPALMAVRACVDEAAGTVALSHPDRAPLTVDPDDPEDSARLLAWVAPLWNPDRPAAARVVRAGVGMTDSDFPSISVLNRASLLALCEHLGMDLAMERFRGNVWLEGLAPFAEFDLVGRDIRIGAATLRVREPITRCRATTVDPTTGVSDADTLGALLAGWGHQEFGVYAEVIDGGRVALGDAMEIAQ